MNRSSFALVVLLALALILGACGAPAAVPAATQPETGSVETVAESPTEVAPAEVAPAEAAPAEEASAEETSTEAEAAPAAEAAAPASTLQGEQTFIIVPEESTAYYIANEEFFADALGKYGIDMGTQDTVGKTQEIAGQLSLNLDDLSNALGENTFTVQLNTLESDQRLRDGWIRDNGPQFNQYPEAAFVATSIEGAPAAYSDGDEVNFKLIGDLTLHDVTQPVTFDVTARLAGTILTGVAETRLLMSNFGIEPPSFIGTLTVKDEFGIKVEFTAQAQ